MFDVSSGGARIDLVELTKHYPGQPVPAVDHVTMEIPAGELVMFVGPSGCGKTTTMKMINRLIEPSSGSIRIGDEDVLKLSANDLRRHIGYVIQQIGLFPHMTIAENVGIVPKLLGWNRKKAAARIEELMTLVGLDPAAFGSRFPRQLSGGQQQRVGVARALAADPPVMLMDEPFGATDPITRERLQNEFRRLQSEIKKTIIFVTHDFEEAVKLGDRIAVLADQSRIEQYDTPSRILAAPANDYVASFIGSGAMLKRLGLLTLADVPPRTAVTVGAGEPEDSQRRAAADDPHGIAVVVDEDGRPVRLVSGDRPPGDGRRATPLTGLGPATTLRDAVDALISQDTTWLAVTDPGGRYAGVLSFDDIRASVGHRVDAGVTSGVD